MSYVSSVAKHTSRFRSGRATLRVAAAVAALVFVACGDDPAGPGDSAVREIQLDPISASAASLGEVIQFTVRLVGRGGVQVAAVPLTWASSDTTVLVSEGDGRFVARGNGTATVSVGLASDPRVPPVKAQITVHQLAARLEFASDTLALFAIGDTSTVQARAYDGLGSEMAVASTRTWRSADPSVAMVDPTGRVTAVRDGQLLITLEVGPLEKSVFVRVSATVRIAGCVSSADSGGDICRTVDLSVRAAR